MTVATETRTQLMLGDEAVARAALDAGVGAAYGYPGTPSTEILESLIAWNGDHASYVAAWCSNEKTAFEQALGASMAGRRALVTMKHVGLNVAADPYINSVLLELSAGFVLVVADDPGMHSSQNEQDSRFYTDFARAPCLEPATQQEAYDMTREAFRLSEALKKPVMVRLVTRVAHSRAAVSPALPGDSAASPVPDPGAEPGHAGNPVAGSNGRIASSSWSLLPANSRRLWAEVLRVSEDEPTTGTARRHNRRVAGPAANGNHADAPSRAVVTCGIARNYYEECLPEIDHAPLHIHIGHYPVDAALFGDLPASVEEILVLEDGYPFVERWLRSVVRGGVAVRGKESGALPAHGELSADIVRSALGIALRLQHEPASDVPSRPPQLCRNCPHADSFAMIAEVREGMDSSIVTSDIGCYALGALPPLSVIDSLVCMGASIGMAKGAAEAGRKNVVATIGDSTFLHSGIPSLLDAAEADTPMTVIILDNGTVAMTGGQPPSAKPGSLERIVQGLGVAEEHIITLKPTRSAAEENAQALRKEMAHEGLSVIIARRACVKVRPQQSEKKS